MDTVPLTDYKASVKQQRTAFFPTAYEAVYKEFINAGYHRKDEQYFWANASAIVQDLRSRTWNAFVPLEKAFTSKMLSTLIDGSIVEAMPPSEAILWFVETYPEHIYQLSLSNTQSRRSRAGKEFEAIIELVLLGSGIPLDTQGNIGTTFFADRGLGKLVDVVSPGVTEYQANKRNTTLISAKTTLRERWQEVPEEMGRTGAKEMFLITLDGSASNDVLTALYEQNVQLTTTQQIKEHYYPNNPRVLTFEDLIIELKKTAALWQQGSYTQQELEASEAIIEKQILQHRDHEFVTAKYLIRKHLIQSFMEPSYE